MTTSNLNPNPLLFQKLPLDSFMLLDVGCRGGVIAPFHRFENRLKMVGFDPLIEEIDRLNSKNKNPNIKYIAAYVGAESYETLFPPEARSDTRINGFFDRTSAMRAIRLAQLQQQEEGRVPPSPPTLAKIRVGLDDYCVKNGISKVDFIKVDTDGSDYEVLISADKLLSNGVLGATIECQFHGPAHPHANLFCNIDRFMRERGFLLFDLDVHRYSREALPLPFRKNMVADTCGGAICWAEAVYFRDLTDVDYEKKWKIDITLEDVVKLAGLYDLYGLGDCAAELILKRPEAFQAGQREAYLDLLVADLTHGKLNYRQFMDGFDYHPEFWYPERKTFKQR